MDDSTLTVSVLGVAKIEERRGTENPSHGEEEEPMPEKDSVEKAARDIRRKTLRSSPRRRTSVNRR
jgi:hypothetical protein